MGTVVNMRLMRSNKHRRLIALVLIVILLLIAFFPPTYRTASTVVATEPAQMGLAGVLGQTAAFNSAFGNQAALEIALDVGRSQLVRRAVIKRLDLVRLKNFSSVDAADRWLNANVDVSALRGGLITIEMKNRDPQFGLAVVSATTLALRNRLSEIARDQTAYKRKVIDTLLATSYNRLVAARAAYDNYRLKTGNASPQMALGMIGGRIPALREELKTKEIALHTAQAFATEDNMAVRAIQVQMQVLRGQLAEAIRLNPDEQFSIERVVTESTKVRELEREFVIAQSHYDAYRNFAEGTAVEDLTSYANIRVLRPAYIDAAWQFRMAPTVLAVLILLMALTAEVYLLRPPVSEVRARTVRED